MFQEMEKLPADGNVWISGIIMYVLLGAFVHTTQS